MWLAVLLSCRDPILAEIEAVPLPALPSAEAARAVPVVAVTGREILLDSTPWRDLLPAAAPERILSLSPARDDELALPALMSALEPLREAAVQAARPPLIAVAAGADVPYREVVRVLYSLGLARFDEVELRVTTPTGPGSVPFWFPGYCSSGIARPEVSAPEPPPEPVRGEATPAGMEQILRSLRGPAGPCVMASISEVPAGLRVQLEELDHRRAACGAVIGVLDPTSPPAARADSWRGAVVVPADDACPSVTGRDAAALRQVLGRAAKLGEPCSLATLTALDATPWGEVVALLTVVRERHPGATLGVSLDGHPTDCAPSWVLDGR